MRSLRNVSLRPRASWRSLLMIVVVAILGWSPFHQARGAEYAPFGADELRDLVAPVALYPDALLAQVLTASTYPDDVVSAARWIDAGNNPADADRQPWDSSVAGVARYPTVLRYMASNGDWMNDLGDAFLNQQSDVMSAVQDLRGDALAAGTLRSTSEQTVINEDGYIQIIPTNPQYLYAPIYDPRVVYAPPPVLVGSAYPTYVTFGPRVAVGEWLDCDFDWHDRVVYYGRWGHDRPWWHDRDRFRYADVRPGIYRPGRFHDARGRAIEVQASRWRHDDRRPAPRRVERTTPRPTILRPERGYPPRSTGQSRRLEEMPRGADVPRQIERGRTSRERAVHAPIRYGEPPRRIEETPRREADEPKRVTETPKRPAEQPRREVEAPKRTVESPRREVETPKRTAEPPKREAEAPKRTVEVPKRTAEEPKRVEPPQRAPDAPRAAPRREAPEARPSAPTRGGAMGGYQSRDAASRSGERGSSSRGRH